MRIFLCCVVVQHKTICFSCAFTPRAASTLSVLSSTVHPQTVNGSPCYVQPPRHSSAYRHKAMDSAGAGFCFALNPVCARIAALPSQTYKEIMALVFKRNQKFHENCFCKSGEAGCGLNCSKPFSLDCRFITHDTRGGQRIILCRYW